ncbi:hypothetical protein VDGD_03874 [Verticillium dahliae]|nr:hypothetical protein VDGD_03874 [Verticillium dahliae]
MVDTYNSKYEDGSDAHGGFASHIRAHWYFVFRIPDALDSADAAPLLCAGLTTYSPLVRAGIKSGSKVAVIGIGGLGHLGLQWAKALGAEVYALTHSPSKEKDAKALGAAGVIDTNEDGWADKRAFQFDFVLNCTDAADKFDLPTYLSILNIGGEFHMVGLGDKSLPQMPPSAFASNAAKLTGSHIGNRQEMQAMLKLAGDKNITPMVEKLPLGDKGLKEAVERVQENKVRYRFTMTDFDKAFKA